MSFKKTRVRNAFIVAVAVLAFGLGTQVEGQQKAPSVPQVKVVNTAAEAIPVALSPGSTVGISGTPTVAIAPGASVTVNSSAAVPLFVQSVSSREPFHVDFFDEVSTGETILSVFALTVPAGKRAVIEFVTMETTLGTGQFVRSVQFVATLNGVVATHRFLAQPNPAEPRTMVLSSPAKIYVDGGTPLQVSFARLGGTTGTVAMFGSVSGYYENVTQPQQ